MVLHGEPPRRFGLLLPKRNAWRTMPAMSKTAPAETQTQESALQSDEVETSQEPSSRQQTQTDPEEVARQVEAALLTIDRPLKPARIADMLGGVGPKAVTQAIETLNAVYEQTGRAFRVERVADGYQLLTLPQYADVLSALHKTRTQTKLSPAALETLAIVAYKQPILRADVEAVRGVACGEVLRSLMERHLVKIVGRADELGRPMLYGTTKLFLEVFGLSSLKDLPNAAELAPPTSQESTSS